MTTTTSVRRPEPARFSERGRRERRRRWVRRVIALLVIALIVGSVWAVGWSSMLGVREVTVQGQHRTSSTTVRDAAKVPIDQPMVRLDVQAIESRVEALPTVQSAQVARVWPHTVRITLTEREPVAVVRHGSERRFISADGVDFAPVDRADPPPLDRPRRRGGLPGPGDDRTRRRRAAAQRREVPARGDRGLRPDGRPAQPAGRRRRLLGERRADRGEGRGVRGAARAAPARARPST